MQDQWHDLVEEAVVGYHDVLPLELQGGRHRQDRDVSLHIEVDIPKDDPHVRQQTQQWRFITRRAAATGGELVPYVACSSGCARDLAPARLPAAAGPATGRFLQQMCHRWHHRV